MVMQWSQCLTVPTILMQGWKEKDDSYNQSKEEAMKQEKEENTTQVTQTVPTPTKAALENLKRGSAWKYTECISYSEYS